MVHISQGEHGSLGGVRGGGGAGVAGRDAAPRGGRAEQRVAAIVCLSMALLSVSLSVYTVTGWIVPVRRLNAHVVSLLSCCRSATAFQMPAEVDGRSLESTKSPDRRDVEYTCRLSGRLSSFGFSGTIAHSSFCCRRSRLNR